MTNSNSILCTGCCLAKRWNNYQMKYDKKMVSTCISRQMCESNASLHGIISCGLKLLQGSLTSAPLRRWGKRQSNPCAESHEEKEQKAVWKLLHPDHSGVKEELTGEKWVENPGDAVDVFEHEAFVLRLQESGPMFPEWPVRAGGPQGGCSSVDAAGSSCTILELCKRGRSRPTKTPTPHAPICPFSLIFSPSETAFEGKKESFCQVSAFLFIFLFLFTLHCVSTVINLRHLSAFSFLLFVSVQYCCKFTSKQGTAQQQLFKDLPSAVGSGDSAAFVLLDPTAAPQ